MTTPATGPSSPSSPQQPDLTTPSTQRTTPPAASTPSVAQSTSFEDPTGAWSRFLSASGTQASPEQVHMFLHSLLDFFSKVIMTQRDAAAKRSAKSLKDAIEGTNS